MTQKQYQKLEKTGKLKLKIKGFDNLIKFLHNYKLPILWHDTWNVDMMWFNVELTKTYSSFGKYDAIDAIEIDIEAFRFNSERCGGIVDDIMIRDVNLLMED